VAGLTLALGACSGDSMPIPKFDMGLADPKMQNPVKEAAKQRVATAADLIGPNGYCPGEAAPAAAPQALNFTAGPQTGPANAAPSQVPGAAPAAPAVRGPALGMTECEVVQAIGHTDRIEISTNERGQRAVTLTYPLGQHPGIYRFVAGQLVSLERTNEPPAAPKAAKPKKAAKKEPPA
jgi:hypothetical protein